MEFSVHDFYTELDSSYKGSSADLLEEYLLEKAAGLSDENELYIAVYNELGAFYRSKGRYDESIDCFKKSAHAIAGLSGDASADHGTVLNNLAGAYRMKGDYDKALVLFDRSREIYDKTVGKKHFLYSCLLNNLAILYQETKDYEKALDAQKEALEILDGLDGYDTEKSTCLLNLANIYHMLGKREEAAEVLKMANQVKGKA